MFLSVRVCVCVCVCVPGDIGPIATCLGVPLSTYDVVDFLDCGGVSVSRSLFFSELCGRRQVWVRSGRIASQRHSDFIGEHANCPVLFFVALYV